MRNSGRERAADHVGVLHVHGDVKVVLHDVADLGEHVLEVGCLNLADVN